ncbi:hypothetical protein GCM10025879_15140 [Leuconostoc litchii]|nr:hypothetical protein GCM10025879_15140 [Leuconostoc litchii]
MTLTNKFNLDDISSSNNLIEKATLEMIVVRKISIVEFFINMLFKHNNPKSNIVHRVPLSKGDTIHVHDIQPGHLDGTDLGNGSFSFSVRQQSYPFWV